jgi:hypothetical protein
MSPINPTQEGSAVGTEISQKLEKLKSVYHKIVTHVSFLPDNLLEPSIEDLFKKLLALNPSVRRRGRGRAEVEIWRVER